MVIKVVAKVVEPVLVDEAEAEKPLYKPKVVVVAWMVPEVKNG